MQHWNEFNFIIQILTDVNFYPAICISVRLSYDSGKVCTVVRLVLTNDGDHLGMLRDGFVTAFVELDISLDAKQLHNHALSVAERLA